MSTGDDEIRPWDYPPIVLEPVTIHELFDLIDNARDDSQRTSVVERPVHLLPLKEMEDLPNGTGYYKRLVAEGEVTSLDHMFHSWLLYFGIQIGNFQVITVVDLPQYRSTFVRARPDDKSPYGNWFMFTTYRPIPLDRSILLSEIFQHA